MTNRNANTIVDFQNGVTPLNAENLNPIKASIVQQGKDITAVSGVVATQQTEINNLGSQLDEKVNSQENFIETFNNIQCFENMFSIVVNSVSPLNLSIFYNLLNGKSICYNFFKKINDDFQLVGNCRYGDKGENYSLLSTENLDSKTGTWVEANPPSIYTSEVGATFTKKIVCAGLDFFHYADNRGGIWEFIIDGNVENKKIISTYSNAPASKKIPLIREKISKEHTIIATFKGDDPEHEPSSGVGTSRGWVYCKYDSGASNHTFDVYQFQPQILNSVELFPTVSNKEFAIQIKKDGETHTHEFVPEHSGKQSTTCNKEPLYIINGVPHNFKNGEILNGIQSFQIIQDVFGYNPNDINTNLVKINSVTSFDNNGLINMNGKIIALENLNIFAGYGIMFPFATTFGNRLVSGFGNSYETTKIDYSATFLEDESDKVFSYIALNNSTLSNIGVICNFNSPSITLRQGKNGKPVTNRMTKIEHRSDVMQKLYQQVFQDYNMPKGEVYRFSGTIKVINVVGLNDIL